MMGFAALNPPYGLRLLGPAEGRTRGLIRPTG